MTPYTINRIVNSVVGDSPIRVTAHSLRHDMAGSKALLFEGRAGSAAVAVRHGTTPKKLRLLCQGAAKYVLSGGKNDK